MSRKRFIAKYKMLDHMTRKDRQRRLYDHLKSLGLFVWGVPVPGIAEDDLDGEVNYICVSTTPLIQVEEPPASSAHQPSLTGVASPVSGPEIGEGVRSTKQLGPNVIEFPPVL